MLFSRTVSKVLSAVLLFCNVAVAGVSCDVNDDVVTGSNENSFDFVNATFTVCIRFNTTHSGSARQILSKGISGSSWFIGTTSAGLMSVNIRNAAAEAIASRNSVSAVNNGAVHTTCVVFTTHSSTRDSNLISIYVDGLLDQGSIAHAGTGGYAQNADQLQLCRGVSGFMAVTIHDLVIYSGDIGATAVLNYHSSGIKRPQLTVTTLAYWPLWECGAGQLCNGVVFRDEYSLGSMTGDDGANNTGMTGAAMATPLGGIVR